jgi:predicted metal-dependent enzyme (double-stranded beta helix superfamily)
MFDIDHLVADCHAALAEPSPQLLIRELVARAVTQASEVERALGTPRLGGLFPLHRSPGLTILNVVWAPGMAIYPHDHRIWAVIGLYGGREDNTFYRRSPQGLVGAGARRLAGTPGSLVERPFDVERARQVHAEANERWAREQGRPIFGTDQIAFTMTRR